MSARRLHVWQIDDDENDRILLDRAVRRCSLPITLSSKASPIEALTNLRKDGPTAAPDLILLDVRMPLMNGFEFIRELRAGAFFKDSPPVVMLSTSAEAGDVQQARQAGALAYYVKPDGMEELRALVQDLYGRWSESKLAAHWPAPTPLSP